MAHLSDRTEGQGKKGEVVQNLTGADSLGFLDELPELNMPQEILTLITSLKKNIEILDASIRELKLQRELSPEDSKIQLDINRKELKKVDFTAMIRQLSQFPNEPSVIQAARIMNAIYSRRKGESRGFLDSIKSFLLDDHPVEQREYLDAELKLNDALDGAQDRHIALLASTGDSNALLETYVVTLDRYTMLTDIILQLPKEERDKNIDNLITTLTLHESFTLSDYQEKVAERIGKTAQEILNNQKKSFEGVRGVVQEGMEKGIDVVTDIFGGKEGISRIVSGVLGKAAKKFIEPTKLEEYVIQSVQEDVTARIKAIGNVVDMSVVDDMHRACLALKANPDNVLNEKDKQEFMEAFRKFIPVATRVRKKVIETQVDLIQLDFPLSRDDEISEFPADSEGRAKLMQIQGRDIVRLTRLYSPFGIFLPETVEREKGKEPVRIRSAYDTGWFKEHPFLSTGLQGVELAALLRLAPTLAKLSMKVGYYIAPIPGKSIARAGLKKIGSIIGKRVGQGVMSGPLSIAFAVIAGVEVGNELQEIRITASEEEVIKIIEKYVSLRDISPEDGEKIRILTLRNELEKRRGAFQEIGVNLGDSGVSIIDRFFLGNVGSGLSPRANMKETGQLREALLEANRKLVLLGLKPFVMF